MDNSFSYLSQKLLSDPNIAAVLSVTIVTISVTMVAVSVTIATLSVTMVTLSVTMVTLSLLKVTSFCKVPPTSQEGK